MTQFKEKGEPQEFVSAGPLHLPGADGGRHPALPDRPRPDRRRPAPAPRARARRRASASTRASARRSRCRRAIYPEVGRADHGPAGADEEDVDDRSARRRGRSCMLDPPDVIRKKVKTRGHRLGPRGAPRSDDKPGVTNLIDIMTVATGEPRRGDRGALRRRRLRAVQGGRRRGGGRAARARSRSAIARSAPTTGELQRLLARRRREGPRGVAQPTLEQMYDRMGFVSPKQRSSGRTPARSVQRRNPTRPSRSPASCICRAMVCGKPTDRRREIR